MVDGSWLWRVAIQLLLSDESNRDSSVRRNYSALGLNHGQLSSQLHLQIGRTRQVTLFLRPALSPAPPPSPSYNLESSKVPPCPLIQRYAGSFSGDRSVLCSGTTVFGSSLLEMPLPGMQGSRSYIHLHVASNKHVSCCTSLTCDQIRITHIVRITYDLAI